MGWHANYVVEFDEKAAPDLDWEDSRVKEAMKKLESRNSEYWAAHMLHGDTRFQ
jgi:hypothetical protein